MLLLCDGRSVPDLQGEMEVHVLCYQCGVVEVGPRYGTAMALTSVSCTQRPLCTARGAPAHCRRPET